MALKQSNLQQIPQRNKDLTFGYVKECEKRNKSIIPSMIKYLCLIYFNQNKDEFDIKYTHSEIKINGKSIEFDGESAERYEKYNSYLQNIVSNGTQIWRFRCDRAYFVDRIGIRNVDTDKLRLKGYFEAALDEKTVVGYGLQLSKQLTNAQYADESGPEYGQICNDGDVIEMHLDFENLILRFRINECDYGKALIDIKPGKYRAVIGFYKGFGGLAIYTLMSYQHSV